MPLQGLTAELKCQFKTSSDYCSSEIRHVVRTLEVVDWNGCSALRHSDPVTPAAQNAAVWCPGRFLSDAVSLSPHRPALAGLWNDDEVLAPHNLECIGNVLGE